MAGREPVNQGPQTIHLLARPLTLGNRYLGIFFKHFPKVDVVADNGTE